MTPENWINAFLAKRGLEKPTGDPFFVYKPTLSEYQILTEVLRKTDVDSFRWDACFVFYACEWWRRNYDGSYWKWDPLLEVIGQAEELAASTRSDVVKKGFKFWKRSIYKRKNRHDFLGTILFESGLPESLLSSDHYISNLINSIYNELGAISSMEEAYLDFIEREMANARLPNSLKQSAFYSLIGEIIATLANLQESYNLSVQENPVAYLDEHIEDWRDEFPISIDPGENTPARLFIDNLMSDLTKTAPPSGYLARIDYMLEAQEEEWFCSSYLHFDEGTFRYERFGLSATDYKGLSSKVELFCSNGVLEFSGGYVFKTGVSESLKTDGVKGDLLDQNALLAEPWSLFLSDPKSGNNFDIPLLDQDFSRDSAPLVFAFKQNRWQFIGSGTVRSREEQLRVLVNESARIKGEGYRVIGKMNPGRIIIEIFANCTIDIGGNTFRISPNTEDTRTHYEFHPQDNAKVFPYFPRQNKQVFLGFPRVYEINRMTNRTTRVLAGLEYQQNGQWYSVGSSSTYGQLRVRLQSGDGTKFVKTITVLPGDIHLQFVTAHSSSLLLQTQVPCQLAVKSDVFSEIHNREGGQKMITFDTSAIASDNTPEYCQLVVQFEGAHKAVTLTVPFPRRSVAIYDKNNQRIPRDARVYVNNLQGSRLSIMNHSEEPLRKRVIISLVTRDKENNIRLSRPIDLAPFEYEPIPMISFQHQFNRLFSLTTSIDAYLRFEIEDQRIRIAQFPDVTFDFTEAGLHFNNVEHFDDVLVNAMRLDVPFKKENIQSLAFDEEQETYIYPGGDGLWLIYPSPESEIVFRPRVLRVMADEPEAGAIREMYQVALLSHEDRKEKMIALYDVMAHDLHHPDWPRLIELFLATSHLPLSTFDNWRYFDENTEVLITAVFMLQKQLIERLTEEFSIIWHEYPIRKWITVFERYRSYAHSAYQSVAEIVIQTKIQIVEELLGLKSHTHILQGESQLLPPQVIKHLIKEQLNGKEGQAGLRARHHGTWPDKFNSALKSQAKMLPDFIRELIPREIHESQIGVVYLPFIMATAASGIAGIDLHEETVQNRFGITEMIEFDKQWFEEIYDYTLGYIWSYEQMKKD